MNRYFFTFGSDPQFPFQNTYLVIEAKDINQAIGIFRLLYPDRHPGVYNASDCYTEAEWDDRASKYYANRPAAQIIRLQIVDF